MEQENFNKNDKQLFFNQIKGSIYEINGSDGWYSITLNVGHESTRYVNFSIKSEAYEKIKDKYLVGDKVLIRFYLTSRFKNERWYTVANILQMDATI